jgi:hypothetical protein
MINATACRQSAKSILIEHRMMSCFRILGPPGKQPAAHPLGVAGLSSYRTISRRRSQVHRPILGVHEPPPMAPGRIPIVSGSLVAASVRREVLHLPRLERGGHRQVRPRLREVSNSTGRIASARRIGLDRC